MPNWCMNKLSVKGKKKQISEFKKKAKGESSDLSMDNFFPTPRELLEKDRQETENNKPQSLDWYKWRLHHWGCKWDIRAELVDQKEDELDYSFDSPWSPPVEFILNVSTLYKRLNFNLEYDEPGNDFAGKLECAEGQIIEEKSYPSHINSGWDDIEESEGRIEA